MVATDAWSSPATRLDVSPGFDCLLVLANGINHALDNDAPEIRLVGDPCREQALVHIPSRIPGESVDYLSVARSQAGFRSGLPRRQDRFGGQLLPEAGVPVGRTGRHRPRTVRTGTGRYPSRLCSLKALCSPARQVARELGIRSECAMLRTFRQRKIRQSRAAPASPRGTVAPRGSAVPGDDEFAESERREPAGGLRTDPSEPTRSGAGNRCATRTGPASPSAVTHTVAIASRRCSASGASSSVFSGPSSKRVLTKRRVQKRMRPDGALGLRGTSTRSAPPTEIASTRPPRSRSSPILRLI